MSGYRGRTGPNVLQYITDLNTLSPPEQQFIDDNDFSNDLAMYTNTDFTNIDIPGLEDDAFDFTMRPESQSQETLKYEELLGGPSQSTGFRSSDASTPPQTQPFYNSYNQPIQPAPAPGFPHSDSIHSVLPRDNKSARAETVLSEHVPTDEKSRVAAEEDKRRRNTAASARFRVKKKQREQALEKTLTETQDKNAKLEARIGQLELENKWLKDLITEKNGLQSKEEMAAAYEQHRIESEDRDLKHEPTHTVGVGTD